MGLGMLKCTSHENCCIASVCGTDWPIQLLCKTVQVVFDWLVIVLE